MVASFRGREPVAEELGAGTYARGALRTRPVRLVRLSEGRTAPAPVEAISGEKEINEGGKKKESCFSKRRSETVFQCWNTRQVARGGWTGNGEGERQKRRESEKRVGSIYTLSQKSVILWIRFPPQFPDQAALLC